MKFDCSSFKFWAGLATLPAMGLAGLAYKLHRIDGPMPTEPGFWLGTGIMGIGLIALNLSNLKLFGVRMQASLIVITAAFCALALNTNLGVQITLGLVLWICTVVLIGGYRLQDRPIILSASRRFSGKDRKERETSKPRKTPNTIG